jgi:hypothetical protein
LNDGAEDNILRKGMPELKSEFQLGPSINIDLTEMDLIGDCYYVCLFGLL